MALSQTVWSLDTKKPLEGTDLVDEKELELLIQEHIEILSKDWLVVNTQVKTDAGKFIDILCIDRDGDMVVVELKKDMTPREVTAQVIDYAASVSKMTVEEIAQQYILRSNGKETLNEAFQNKFGASLEDNSINQNVKMVIVAAKMDNGTERIIRFLREVYDVDINILFFNVFKSGTERIISRTWFEEDMEESTAAELSRKGPWNGEYYASFGEGNWRSWKDARKYGFISAGGGSWYSKTLSLLSKGDRVWVNIPHTGFVGVGIVEDSSKIARDFSVEYNGETLTLDSPEFEADYLHDKDNDEEAEYIVKIKWIKTVDEGDAVREVGFFGNQNSVCRPRTEKWDYTVERLKAVWGI